MMTTTKGTAGKIWITGAKGMLGQAMQKEIGTPTSENDYGFVATGKELDVTNRDAVFAYCGTERPDIIINCAAYTGVDKAEGDEAAALRLNGDAPGIIGEAAAK